MIYMQPIFHKYSNAIYVVNDVGIRLTFSSKTQDVRPFAVQIIRGKVRKL